MFAQSRSFSVEAIQGKVDSEDPGSGTAMVGGGLVGVGVGQVSIVKFLDERC